MSLTQRPSSPFDAIRQTRTDGSEYWSARDLMAATNYERWENFTAAIERAAYAADNQGQSREHHFRGVTKKGAGRPQQDYEVTRFGAYLVMMNGDPRKPEIASAQAYFAVKTREAEVRTELDEIEVAERYLVALREKKALAAKVEADRPLVAQAAVIVGFGGDDIRLPRLVPREPGKDGSTQGDNYGRDGDGVTHSHILSHKSECPI